MPWRDCKDCQTPFWFEVGEEWKVRCIPCWRERKNGSSPRPWTVDHSGEVIRLQRIVDNLEAELESIRPLAMEVGYLRPLAAIGRTVKERWRDFIFLTHPDRHGGHPKAQEITAWINGEVRP